jgi:hypothetical protein
MSEPGRKLRISPHAGTSEIDEALCRWKMAERGL